MPDLTEKRYEFVTAQQHYKSEKIAQAFGLFVKLASAIVAGVVWVSTQEDANDDVKKAVVRGARALLVFVGSGSLLLIWVNLLSWYGYLKREIDLCIRSLPKKSGSNSGPTTSEATPTKKRFKKLTALWRRFWCKYPTQNGDYIGPRISPIRCGLNEVLMTVLIFAAATFFWLWAPELLPSE